jgi:hypothetical protein
MDGLLLVGILILNVLISVWNCYAVGSAWKDTMAMGGFFNKLVLWSAVIQSGVGFSMPIFLSLLFGAVWFLATGENPSMSPQEVTEVVQAATSLWYVAVIFPILGSGFAIWAHSIREAYLRRDFSSIATAGWNSFAQIHNTVSAVNNLGGALGNIGEFFGAALGGRGDGKGKAAILVILIVILSLVLGFMIAFGLVRYFANRAESRIEQYGDSLEGRTA